MYFPSKGERAFRASVQEDRATVPCPSGCPVFLWRRDTRGYGETLGEVPVSPVPQEVIFLRSHRAWLSGESLPFPRWVSVRGTKQPGSKNVFWSSDHPRWQLLEGRGQMLWPNVIRCFTELEGGGPTYRTLLIPLPQPPFMLPLT